MKVLFLLTAAICSLLGCESADQSRDFDKVTKDLSQSIESLKRSLKDDAVPTGKSIQTTASEEFGKLFQIEYRVESLSSHSSAAEIEHSLSELGKEGWDCFSVERFPAEVRFYCKRSARTPLQYLPKMIRPGQ